MSKTLVMALALATIGLSSADKDVCYSPFSAFLQCMADDADKKLQRYLNELSPDIHNTDITKFKEVVLNRMLVRTYINKCNTAKGSTVANKTVDCIADARKQHDQTLCTTREQCRENKISDTKCRDRFDKVHEAACQCVHDGKSSMMNASRIILSGQLEKEFKKCHEDNNVPYPQEKVDQVKKTVMEVAAEILAHHQLPAEVKKTLHVARQALKDIEGQWKGAFCAKCSKDGDQSTVISDKEILDLRKFGGDNDDKEH